MELSREKLENAFAKVITRNRDADPLTLSEKIVERLMYLMEDSDGGSGIQPVRITEGRLGRADSVDFDDIQEAADAARQKMRGRRATPLNERKSVSAPPLPKSSLLITPDDPEFQEAARQAEMQPRATYRDKARVSKIGQESRGESNIEYWTLETLIHALTENTPAEFFFTPNGCDENVKVKAVRNIQPIIATQGPSIVRLEYRNPRMGDDSSTTNTAGQLDHVSISLIASRMFNLSERALNLESAMDSIVAQLEGMYAPRSQSTEPSGRDPGPLDFNLADPSRSGPMGESLPKEKLDPNWTPVDNPQALVLSSVMQQNRKGGNR